MIDDHVISLQVLHIRWHILVCCVWKARVRVAFACSQQQNDLFFDIPNIPFEIEYSLIIVGSKAVFRGEHVTMGDQCTETERNPW